MKIADRPTDMLERQLLANRKVARDRRDQQTGRMKFPHILPYRPYFVRDILAMRAELRRRQHELRRSTARATHA